MWAFVWRRTWRNNLINPLPARDVLCVSASSAKEILCRFPAHYAPGTGMICYLWQQQLQQHGCAICTGRQFTLPHPQSAEVQSQILADTSAVPQDCAAASAAAVGSAQQPDTPNWLAQG